MNLTLFVILIYLIPCSPGVTVLAAGTYTYFGVPERLVIVAISSLALLAVGLFIAASIHAVTEASPRNKPKVIKEFIEIFEIGEVFKHLISMTKRDSHDG